MQRNTDVEQDPYTEREIFGFLQQCVDCGNAKNMIFLAGQTRTLDNLCVFLFPFEPELTVSTNGTACLSQVRRRH